MNWIKNQNGTQELSTIDKIKELLKIDLKLVLVQADELRKLKQLKTYHTNDIVYVNQLYKHYITLGLGKTFLY